MQRPLLDLNRFRFLRLWVEQRLMEDYTSLYSKVAREVLSRCFGCAGELSDQERQTSDGLSRQCREGQVWKWN